MNNTYFASKKLKGRDVSAAPRINNYNNSVSTKEVQKCRTLLPICEAGAPLFLSAVYNKKYTSEKITSRCPQSGRSMIEMLGVLAIIGVLSVGGIAGYSKAMMKYRINKTIEQVTLITGNIRTFFKNNYDGLECIDGDMEEEFGTYGCKIIKKAKLVPDEMITLENNKFKTLTNIFGGAVTLFGGGRGFSMVFQDIPPEACIELATYDWSATGINVVGTYSSTANDGGAYTPMDLDKAITLCQGAEEMWFSYNDEGPSNWGYFLE